LLSRFGQPRPILVRAANHMIIAGHGVHQAMSELARTEIDALVWDVDQSTADQYLVADNRFSELDFRLRSAARFECQPALNIDPRSASKIDPPAWWLLPVVHRGDPRVAERPLRG